MRSYKDIPLWKDVTPEEWNDWKWQLRNRITSVDQLKQVISLTPEEEAGVRDSLRILRMAITPFYATLMDPNDPHCPMRLQAVPTAKEIDFSEDDMEDPLFEDIDSPVHGLTHRYPDKVLFLITDQCGMYCRHCTRRRLAGQTDTERDSNTIDAVIKYIEEHEEIRDVLLSGGDPLTVSDKVLEDIISRLQAIDHVEIVRLGSRTPCVLPQRITPELCDMLKKHHPIWLNTHFNHPKEITPEAKAAVERLADAGIPVGNQSVLLKGINDCPTIMKKLVHELVKIRCRPYYYYQCDMSRGIEHFRTSVAKGMEIQEALRGHTSGYAVPLFIVDAPGGGGKIPLSPNYFVSMSDKRIVLRNYEGGTFQYPEPKDRVSTCPPNCKMCKDYSNIESTEGVAGVLSGKKFALIPEGNARAERRKHYDKH
ncbi:MAG: lysine 2,3-aminomutase [Thermoplasmata archaeon]|nr:lysine 2,3-aminomutase [Thermoplasmata archaeon]TFG68088.1 MAG: lysine 2,3-aminomutase [Methanomassiliicoccus sp.]